MDHQVVAELPAHVLMFPYPLMGHVPTMLKLAELLCDAGIHVTFLVTDHIHSRLLRHSNVLRHFTRSPGFRFQTISDGLPEDDDRSGERVIELFYSFPATAKPLLRELLISNRQQESDSWKPITCLIADGIVSFAYDVAEEFGIPALCYRTSAASDFWAFYCAPKLIEAGEFPFKGTNLDELIASVSGMDGFLRRRDLPSFFRAGDVADRTFQIVLNETLQVTRTKALILNTFEELEGPVLAEARSQCPKIYTVGPLHEHVKTRLVSPISSSSLLEEDTSCLTWLDAQPLRSVVYVSFGSVTTVTEDQLTEFWHGLMNSEKQFLWVIRHDSIANKDRKNDILSEFIEGAKGRGHVVGWAPQQEVLAHEAVGGFITHSGWNSTLESIAGRVPMICWPSFGDQQINSRFVEEVWKLGFDMKDTCDRLIIEKMVRDLMDVRRDEFMQSADKMATLARKSVSEGGSSYCNLDRLIEDIKLMNGDRVHN